MERLLLEGWLPIILAGVITCFIVIFLAKTIGKPILYAISAVLVIICLGALLYSIFAIGGWAGMGLGFFAISVFLGILVGVFISLFF